MDGVAKSPKHLAQFWGIAVGIILESFAIYWMVFGFLWVQPGYLFLGLSLTISSAYSFKLVLDFPAFSVYSLIHTLPMNFLLCWFVLCSLLAPTSDPVGGNGINAAIVLFLLAAWGGVLGPLSLLSFWFESRNKVWYVVLGILFAPTLMLLLLFYTGVFGW